MHVEYLVFNSEMHWNRANHARTMHNVGGDVNSFTAVPVRAEMSGSMLLSSMLLPQGHTVGCLLPQVLTPVKQAMSAHKVYQALVMVAHMSCYSWLKQQADGDFHSEASKSGTRS